MRAIHISEMRVIGVRADLVKATARLTLEAPLNAEMLRVKQDLAWLAIQDLPVSVDIMEDTQPQLFDVKEWPMTTTEAE